MFCWYSTGCVRREPRKELPYLFVMSTIQEIKTAIGKLSLEERADLIAHGRRISNAFRSGLPSGASVSMRRSKVTSCPWL